MKIYNMVLRLSVEDCETEIILESGFETFNMSISREINTSVSLDYNEAKALIEMLQIALKHQGAI